MAFLHRIYCRFTCENNFNCPIRAFTNCLPLVEWNQICSDSTRINTLLATILNSTWHGLKSIQISFLQILKIEIDTFYYFFFLLLFLLKYISQNQHTELHFIYIYIEIYSLNSFKWKYIYLFINHFNNKNIIYFITLFFSFSKIGPQNWSFFQEWYSKRKDDMLRQFSQQFLRKKKTIHRKKYINN